MPSFQVPQQHPEDIPQTPRNKPLSPQEHLKAKQFAEAVIEIHEYRTTFRGTTGQEQWHGQVDALAKSFLRLQQEHIKLLQATNATPKESTRTPGLPKDP